MIFAVISCTNNETQTTPTEEPTDTVTAPVQVESTETEVQSVEPIVE